jgi:hypothetical protein
MLLTTLKVLAVMVTALLGILGVVTDFRDNQTKRVTRWGKGAILFLFVSALVAVGAEAVDFRKREADAKKSDEDVLRILSRQEKTLGEVRRLLQPVPTTGVGVSFWMKVPLGIDELAPYRLRLQAAADAFLRAAQSKVPDPFNFDMYGSTKDENGAILELAVPRRSKFFPDQEKEPLAFAALAPSGVTICIYSGDKRPADDEYCGMGQQAADLLFVAHGRDEASGIEVEYDVATKTAKSRVSDFLDDGRFARRSGKVVSFDDMIDATVDFSFDYGMPMARVNARESRSVEVRVDKLSGVVVETAVMTMGGRELWLRSPKLTTTRDRTGHFKGRYKLTRQDVFGADESKASAKSLDSAVRGDGP